MARSKKRSFRRSSKRGPKADWVYRGDIHDGAGGTIDNFGTYVPGFGYTQVALPANATVHWLYDSSNYRKFAASVGGNVPLVMPSASRAEGKRAKVLRVQGWMSLLPVAWVAGSNVFLGVRFGVFEQSANTGNGIFVANYNMWDPAINDNASPATFANFPRLNVKEHRMSWSFDIGQTSIVRKQLYFNFRVNRTLAANEGFGIYTELASGSTSLSIVSAFRSLIVDEG